MYIVIRLLQQRRPRPVIRNNFPGKGIIHRLNFVKPFDNICRVSVCAAVWDKFSLLRDLVSPWNWKNGSSSRFRGSGACHNCVEVMFCRCIARECSCDNSSSTCFLLTKTMLVVIPGGVQTVTSSGLGGLASSPLSAASNFHSWVTTHGEKIERSDELVSIFLSWPSQVGS